MSELTTLTPESVQSEIKRTRHKAEHPLYAISIILGIAAVLVVFFYGFKEHGILDMIKDTLAKENITDVSPEFNTIVIFCVTFVSVIGGLGLLIYYIVQLIAAYYLLYAKTISYSIRVSEKNYPELYAKVKEYTRLLGFKKEPEVYIQQSDGSINAFACWAPGKYYVQINAEILEVGYLEHKDLDSVAFIMAHEFGHIYCHHVNMLYSMWAQLIGFVPVLGTALIKPAFSRSQEYSADRVAQALTAGKSQEDAMMLLAAGRHLYKYTDVNDFIEWANKDHNFLERFARFVINFTASHPIFPLRVKAILDTSKKSGRLF